MKKSFYKIIMLAVVLLFCSTVFSLFAETREGIRVSLGTGAGKFKQSGYRNAGDYDHDSSGTAYGVSYIRILENNLIFGVGNQTVDTSGFKKRTVEEENFLGKKETKKYISKTKYQVDFLYVLIGYEIALNPKTSFQPNLRLGSKNFKMASYRRSESKSDLGVEVVLPFIYKLSETVAAGANVCYCNNEQEAKQAWGNDKYTNSSIFNLVLDFYF